MGNNSIPMYPDDASLCELTSCPVATGLTLSHYGSELLIDLEYEKYSKLFFNWFLLIYADQLYALE